MIHGVNALVRKGEGSFEWRQFAGGFCFAAILMSGTSAVSADPASEALERLVAAYPAALDHHDEERIFWRTARSCWRRTKSKTNRSDNF